MTVVALLIAVTLPAADSYDAVVTDLYRAARHFGCTQPVVERLATDGEPLQRLMVTCRMVSPDERAD